MTKKLQAQKKLKLIWGIATPLLIMLVFFAIWHSQKKQTENQLQVEANIISQRIDNFIDNFIENLNQSIYTSNLSLQDLKQCKKNTLSDLRRLVLNNPFILGLAIVNENRRIVCSTLSKDHRVALSSKDIRMLSLYGPLRKKGINKPFFVMQQQLGTANIEVYFLKQNLERLLQSKLPGIRALSLYDNQQHRFLLNIVGHTKNRAPHDSELVAISDNSSHLIRTELVRLNHVDVIIEKDEFQILNSTLISICLFSLFVIVLSIFSYLGIARLIRAHFSLHRALLLALKNNEFYPVYQPIMDSRSNQCCGAEILLRWRLSDQGEMMPESFIDYAEQSELILPITLLIFERALIESHAFLHEHPNFHLALNLSSVHFSDSHFLTHLTDLNTHYAVSNHQIILEVTERHLLQNSFSLVEKMKTFREIGFSLAIDDFGTGHASINYLQHFPFNYLKIDKLFVNAIGTGAITESLNLAIIDIARRLRLHVIAEGVETLEQRDTLEDNGVVLMQGWYFSKALAFEKLILFVRQHQG